MYDKLVGPIFGVAGVDRTVPVVAEPGRVLAPLRAGHALHDAEPSTVAAVRRNLADLMRR